MKKTQQDKRRVEDKLNQAIEDWKEESSKKKKLKRL